MEQVFDHVWGSGGRVDISDVAVIADFLAKSGVNLAELRHFRTYVKSMCTYISIIARFYCVYVVRSRYAAASRQSGLIERIDADAKQSPGVFGVPTMHYDGGSEAEARKPVERLYVKEVALSLLRHRLDSNGLARQQSIAPDVSFARSSTSVPRRLPRLRAARELELATRKTVTC